jgi:hypothetical protein
MFKTVSTPTLATLMFAVIAAVCACHTDEVPAPLTLTSTSAQPSPKPSTSFVGTVPALRNDERPITPMETVGAVAN